MTASCTDARPQGTLLLSRADVTAHLDLDACIEAVEEAFRLHAEGRTLAPGVLGVPADEGGFHIKAAGLRLSRTWFAAKCNGNFPRNEARFGMPSIQGLILLCDGENGYPLAVIDSIAITHLRTAAATAVAARRLARADSKVVTIAGCGHQGRAQVRALSRVLRLEQVFAFDIDADRARRFAREAAEESGLDVRATVDLPAAVARSDVCVTCTPSRRAFLTTDHLPAGMFLAAVGADDRDKQELDPRILAENRVVVDVLEQCAEIGELHHALAAGLMTTGGVHADLADLVAGRKPGRRLAEEIFVFDSTGTALQDVAAAVALYQRAVEAGAGRRIDLLG